MTIPESSTMYDSTNGDNIPANAVLMMGYINGAWQSYYVMVTRFGLTQVTILSITVKAHNTDGSWVLADILDVENGDATPEEAPGWTQAMRLAGRPIIAPYCSRLSKWPAVLAAFKAQNIAPPDFIIADYTGQPHLVPGSVATQWTDNGNIYDISQTNGSWPYSVTVPDPPLPPITSTPVGDKVLNVVAVKADANGNGWLPTNIPWGTFQAATIQGSDPSVQADKAYWPGYCQAQNRDGKVLVCIIGCIPSSVRNVFVLTSQ